MSAALEAPRDQKAGYSSYCRPGNHATCATVGARCACPCHGHQGQEARVAVAHDLRLAVLQTLADHNGVITHAGGRATAVLREAACPNAGNDNFRKVVERMTTDGLIERDVTGTSTWEIRATAVGMAFLTGPERKEKPVVAQVPPPPDGTDLVWEEPKRGRSQEPALTARQERLLRERPESWARVRTFTGKTAASTFAGSIRKGRRPAPAGQWEWAASKFEQGSALYARFMAE